MAVGPLDRPAARGVASGMVVTINGKSGEAPEGETVAQLVARLGLAGQPCAVEVNRAVVPRREHAQRVLREGDVVEVVTLVGGG